MKAFVFAAGLGTRLKPLTDTMPKALVPVQGQPLLYHVIQKLKANGFNQIMINIHHFGQQIIDYVASQNNFGIEIVFSDERAALLDTGGALKKGAWYFQDEPFLIHNVDILSNIDLHDLYQKHNEAQADASLVVSSRETSRYLLFNEQNSLEAWKNVKTGEVKTPFPNVQINALQPLAFAGIHVVSPHLLKATVNWPDKFSVIDFYLQNCHQYKINAYIPSQLKLMDVGKLNTLHEAENFLQQL